VNKDQHVTPRLPRIYFFNTSRAFTSLLTCMKKKHRHPRYDVINGTRVPLHIELNYRTYYWIWSTHNINAYIYHKLSFDILTTNIYFNVLCELLVLKNFIKVTEFHNVGYSVIRHANITNEKFKQIKNIPVNKSITIARIKPILLHSYFLFSTLKVNILCAEDWLQFPAGGVHFSRSSPTVKSMKRNFWPMQS
jgi:hypothetical protein